MCQTLKNSRQTLTNMNILLAVTQVSGYFLVAILIDPSTFLFSFFFFVLIWTIGRNFMDSSGKTVLKQCTS